MRFGLLQANDDDYKEVAYLCNPSKLKYCKKHNYTFNEYKFHALSDRTAHWGRILAIQSILPDYDWLLYLDTDTIITNYEFDVKSYIDNNYDIIIGQMPGFFTGLPKHISTSAILIKNSKWVINEFLPLWYNQTQFINSPYYPSTSQNRGAIVDGKGGQWYEQSAYQYLYDTNDDCYYRTKIIPNSWCNHRAINHNSESFLIHITSNEFGLQDKLDRIRRFLRQFPSKKMI